MDSLTMNQNRPTTDLASSAAGMERDLGRAGPQPKSRTRSKVLKRVKPAIPAAVEGDVLATLDGVLDQDVLEQSEAQPVRGCKAVLGARRLWQFLGVRGWQLA
jgi:hypothetical protein